MREEEIGDIERPAARAWRPEVEENLDGWRLRYTQGVTRRGNSVLAIESEGTMPLDEKLARVADFYRSWGEPVCYQMTQAAQPSNLISTLSSLGYQDDFHTQVQTADLEHVLEMTRSSSPFRPYHEGQCFDGWLDLYAVTSGYNGHSAAMRRGILSRIEPAANFTLLTDGDDPVAVGLGVADHDWVGIYCMVTTNAYHRQGAATQVLCELAKWGRGEKASKMYLQVMEDNPGGLALYAKAGFRFAYQYWYSYPGDER
jgi:ribosomal protein S18 acetylase RimI-like enzyme